MLSFTWYCREYEFIGSFPNQNSLQTLQACNWMWKHLFQVITIEWICLLCRVHSHLPNIKHVATKVHMMVRKFAVLTWMCDSRDLVECVISRESHKVNMTIMTMMTTWCMRVCGLNSVVDYCNVKTHDMWEGNVITWREISTEHICSLGFGDTIEWVKLRRWGCACVYSKEREDILVIDLPSPISFDVVCKHQPVSDSTARLRISFVVVSTNDFATLPHRTPRSTNHTWIYKSKQQLQW